MDWVTIFNSTQQEVSINKKFPSPKDALNFARYLGFNGRVQINEILKMDTETVTSTIFYDEKNKVVGEIFPMKI